jgi:Lipid A disaccharide synthetase
MLTKSLQRRPFSSAPRKLAILANDRQSDLIGSKVIAQVKALSNYDVEFYGYGGQWMAAQGFKQEF